MEIKLCIFDLDDTLISTHKLYIQAIHAAATVMERIGLDFDQAVETQRRIDSQLIPQMGVHKDRFPKSLVLTFRELCRVSDKKVSKKMAKKVETQLKRYGYGVYKTKSPLFRGVKTVLESLAEHNIPVCILTRGDINIQLQRAVDSGVLHHFSQVFVVGKKTEDVFRSICRFYNVEPFEAMMIGNSIAGDVLPALESNLCALYLSNGTYELEGPHQISPEQYKKLYIGKTIKDLLSILEDSNGGSV